MKNTGFSSDPLGVLNEVIEVFLIVLLLPGEPLFLAVVAAVDLLEGGDLAGNIVLLVYRCLHLVLVGLR